MYARVFLLLLLLSSGLFAQNRSSYRWYFGNKTGLDFNTSPPAVLNDGQSTHYEGTSVISDAVSGSLLFYTDGNTIWNRNHQVMATALHPQSYSSTQAAVIIQQPGTVLYHVFTTTSAISFATLGVRHIVVDMSQKNGLGDVISNTVLINVPVCEKVASINTCDGINSWVIFRLANAPEFHAYRFGERGLDTIPVISNSGALFSSSSTLGEMNISPDGKLLACGNFSSSIDDVFDFDFSTGRLSNRRPIKASSSYGVCFSPNSRWLFASTVYDDFTCRLARYDMTASDIAASMTVIISAQNLDGAGYPNFSQMELAPDGKIYIARNNRTYLSTISNPDADSPVFTENAISIGMSKFGLPNFPQNLSIPAPVAMRKDTTICPDMPVQIGNPAQLGYTYSWMPAELLDNPTVAQPLASPTQTTTFKVTISFLGGCSWIDSVTVTIRPRPAVQITSPLTAQNDTLFICQGATTSLAATSGLFSYQWNTGETTPMITINNGGQYIVEVQDVQDGCKGWDTITVTAIPLPVVHANDVIVCQGETAELTVDNPQSSIAYMWKDEAGNIIGNGEKISVFTAQAAQYIVEATNSIGCKAYDTATVNIGMTHIILSLSDSVTAVAGKDMEIVIYGVADREVTLNNVEYTVRAKAEMLAIKEGIYEDGDIIISRKQSFSLGKQKQEVARIKCLALVSTISEDEIHIGGLKTDADTGCVSIELQNGRLYADPVCASKLRNVRIGTDILAIMPNPVQEEVIIRSDYDVQELRLVNNMGEEIHSVSLSIVGKESLRLNVQNCTAGLYFVRARLAGSNEWISKSMMIVK